MRKVKDIRIVAYFLTRGIEFEKIEREEAYNSKKEIVCFYFKISDEEYDRLTTEYVKSIVWEYDQKLDYLKTMVFKLSNNKI
jgi:hypothetical protein